MTPLIFVPRVVPPLARRPSRLHGLAVDTASAGFGFLSRSHPNPAPQRIMAHLPAPVTSPLMEIITSRPLRREVVRQGGPRAARAQDVEDGVENLAEVRPPQPPPLSRGGQQRLQDGPLLVGQVAGIRLVWYWCPSDVPPVPSVGRVLMLIQVAPACLGARISASVLVHRGFSLDYVRLQKLNYAMARQPFAIQA